MKVLVANIEDVMREAAARWTLVAYFLLSTIFLIIFAAAINLDIVDGALAGAKLFGRDVGMRGEVPIEKVVLIFETGFSGVLYFLCTFLAIFATAHLVPRLQEKGTIDLYLSRPISRTKLLLSRYFAGMLLAATNVVYLIGSMWMIVVWKTGVANPRFLLAGAIILFAIATMLSFAFLVGVITSSTAVSIMATFGIYLFASMLTAHKQFEAAVSKEWQAWTIKTMYWVFPKTGELAEAVVRFVGGDALPQRAAKAFTATPYVTTAAFAVGCLILASWLFQRKEF